MGDDFIEIYFICYYNLYITYYTILAVGYAIYSYAVLYNCYYRTYFPPKETLNHYWIFKTFAALGIKFRVSSILDKCSTTEPCASSNSAPLISHLPISPKLPAPWISIHFLPEWICLVWTVTTDGLREYVGLRVWLLSVFAKYPCGFSWFTILFLFITG